MKRLFALILSMILAVTCIGAFAEGNTGEGQPPQGGPGGTPPEGMTPPDGMGEPPEGMTPPDGMGEPPQGGPGGAPGDAPGGQQSNVEGQLGSWSLGGTDADSVGGDDYAYDAALYVTAEGIDTEKSATERISEGTYDDSTATGIVIDDSESGYNGILIVNAEYTIKDAEISLLTDADGSDTCDFSGKGTAIAAFGDDANVTVEDSRSILRVSLPCRSSRTTARL